MKKITQSEITNSLTEFLTNGGVIQKCKPKLAPKKRKSRKKIITEFYIKSVTGHTSKYNYRFLNKYY